MKLVPILTFALLAATANASGPVVSKPFTGAKVNAGTVTLTEKDGALMLTLSDDFKVPETPAPHWQVVDARGGVYLLQRLMIKGDKLNKSITVPAYVPDIAKVQIWCAWAEVVLGETSFPAVQVRAACARKAAEVKCVSGAFQGVKANVGHVTATMEGTQLRLTLSDDFKVPETPAPHWQVVDSKGNTYLLQRLKIKGDKVNTSIVVPATIGDVVKVQIWCSFAETLLGEASFQEPVNGCCGG